MLISIAESDKLILETRHLNIARSVLKDVEGFIPRALTHVSTSSHSRDAERVLALIKRRGGKMLYRDILQANSWKLSAKEMQGILETLEDRGEVYHQRQGRASLYIVGRKP
jgi:hypothetical protein